MKKFDLKGPEIPTLNGQNPKYLCIILHGYGADGYDLASLCEPLSEQFPDMQFLVPNAPVSCEINPQGFQWFSLYDRAETAMYNEVLKAELVINSYIDQQLARFNLTEDNLIIAGFSQGAMLALHTMLRRPKSCKMIVGFSGMMLGKIEQIKSGLKSSPRICLIHGKNDPVVPFEAFLMSCDKFKACDINFTSKAITHLGHSIDLEGLNFAINQIKEAIDE